MNKKTRFTGNWVGRVLTLLFVLVLGFLSIQINISPIVAGKAGASSISSASTESTRWGLETVKAKNAWKITQGSDEVVVAVIDSGIDRTIPAIKDRMWKNTDEIPGDGRDNDNNGYVDDVYGWDFRDGGRLSKSGRALHYHGTFVSGLVSSNYDRETGSGGVAPNVSIMDLRFLDSAGRFYTSDWGKLAEAIRYAVNNGADIINLSIYASITPPELVHDALEEAESAGVLVVGIAGNSGKRVGYFGRWKEVFTVGSVDKSGKISNFSNYGPEVELVAPGSKVLSYRPGGKLATGSGTSFAAPHVAGTAALILSQNPTIDLLELKDILRQSARDIGRPGRDESSGYGIIDSERSLSKIIQTGAAEEPGTKIEEKVDVPETNRSPDLGTNKNSSGKSFKISLDI